MMPAIRVVVDFSARSSYEENAVHLIVFDDGTKTSFRNKGCTWHYIGDPKKKLVETDMVQDQNHVNVYYLIYKDPLTPNRYTPWTKSDTILNYVGRVTRDEAHYFDTSDPPVSCQAAAARPSEETSDLKDKKANIMAARRAGKDLFGQLSQQKYFDHVYINFILNGFVRMLRIPPEKYEEIDGLEILCDGVDMPQDPSRAQLFVSYATKKIPRL